VQAAGGRLYRRPDILVRRPPAAESSGIRSLQALPGGRPGRRSLRCPGELREPAPGGRARRSPVVARRHHPGLPRLPQKLAQTRARRGRGGRPDRGRQRYPQPATADAPGRDPGHRVGRARVDPDADRGAGGSNHGIPQDVSEHEFNTSGLSTWAGLKPPAAGSRPDVRILGVPLDRGSLYRPGAAKAPAQLRKMSAIFAPVSEQAELFDTVTLQDDGDVSLVDGDMGANVEHGAAEIGSRIGSDALHISLDIDSLDPSYAPGTGVPSAGGLTSRELLDFLRQLRGVRLAGLDVDEVAPPLDVGHVTSLAALKFIFEYIGMVKLGANS